MFSSPHNTQAQRCYGETQHKLRVDDPKASSSVGYSRRGKRALCERTNDQCDCVGILRSESYDGQRLAARIAFCAPGALLCEISTRRYSAFAVGTARYPQVTKLRFVFSGRQRIGKRSVRHTVGSASPLAPPLLCIGTLRNKHIDQKSSASRVRPHCEASVP